MNPANDVQPLTGAQASFAAMMAKLAQLMPREIRGDADEHDLRSANANMLSIAAVVDEHLLNYGKYIAYRTSGIDTKQFEAQLTGALCGNATWEIDQAAERVIAERREGCAGVRHYNRRA